MIGIAARGLAAACRRAGLRAIVFDLFGDDDTRDIAVQAIPLRRLSGLSIDPDDLFEQLSVHIDHSLPVVLGSGFEQSPDIVERLAGTFRLLGSSGQTVSGLKNPLTFTALLRDLGIPHPRLFAGAAQEGVSALEKQVGGSGGWHVRPAREARGAGWYLQEQVEGRTVSALFLGAAGTASLLAFSEQWCEPDPDTPYRYGGAAGPIRLDPALEAEIAAALARIVDATGLVGLASADLILTSDGWRLIEINPRPGASLDVFDRPPLPPLMQLHVEACYGTLPARGVLDPSEAGGVRAVGLFYAPSRFEMRLEQMPDWTADRPAQGTRFEVGDPVCTVCAEAGDVDAARALVRERTKQLWQALSLASRRAAE